MPRCGALWSTPLPLIVVLISRVAQLQDRVPGTKPVEAWRTWPDGPHGPRGARGVVILDGHHGCYSAPLLIPVPVAQLV